MLFSVKYVLCIIIIIIIIIKQRRLTTSVLRANYEGIRAQIVFYYQKNNNRNAFFLWVASL
jgi:hypothetical protein